MMDMEKSKTKNEATTFYGWVLRQEEVWKKIMEDDYCVYRNKPPLEIEDYTGDYKMGKGGWDVRVKIKNDVLKLEEEQRRQYQSFQKVESMLFWYILLSFISLGIPMVIYYIKKRKYHSTTRDLQEAKTLRKEKNIADLIGIANVKHVLYNGACAMTYLVMSGILFLIIPQVV